MTTAEKIILWIVVIAVLAGGGFIVYKTIQAQRNPVNNDDGSELPGNPTSGQQATNAPGVVSNTTPATILQQVNPYQQTQTTGDNQIANAGLPGTQNVTQ